MNERDLCVLFAMIFLIFISMCTLVCMCNKNRTEKYDNTLPIVFGAMGCSGTLLVSVPCIVTATLQDGTQLYFEDTMTPIKNIEFTFFFPNSQSEEAWDPETELWYGPPNNKKPVYHTYHNGEVEAKYLEAGDIVMLKCANLYIDAIYETVEYKVGSRVCILNR
jgi:hypothetical protein